MELISTALPHGWRWVTDARERLEFEVELERELPRQHILVGKPARLIARHEKRDDFLFRTGHREVAQVHLTWAVETDPFFPHAEVHPSLEQWAKTGGFMK